MRRALSVWLALVGVIGAVLTAHCISVGIWTTALAAAGLVVAALAALAGRTWGVLAMLAVGASFASAAALGMTNAPGSFAAIAVIAAVPTVWIARPLGRRDRSAATVLLAVAITLGVWAAVVLRASAPAVETVRAIAAEVSYLQAVHADTERLRARHVHLVAECERLGLEVDGQTDAAR